MIKGSIVALVTPFTKKGKVNYRKLKELLNFHLLNKTDGILLFGTTGEGSTLSFKEKVKIGKVSIKFIKNKIPVILNASSNSTYEAMRLTRRLSRIHPDALLHITPYYNKSNEEGIFTHFKMVSEISKVPIIIYNVPSRTNYDIPIKLIKRLKQIPNIVGIKEASKNEEKLIELNTLQDENFSWLSGNDDRMIEDIKMGARGLIGVVNNSHPKLVKEIVFETILGNYKISEYKYSKLKKYIDSLSLEVNPIPIKCALNYLNFNVGNFRLPLYEMSKFNKAILIDCLEDIK
jgi:4-hydroxy-tetrahydrodipicolinate synthase